MPAPLQSLAFRVTVVTHMKIPESLWPLVPYHLLLFSPCPSLTPYLLTSGPWEACLFHHRIISYVHLCWTSPQLTTSVRACPRELFVGLASFPKLVPHWHHAGCSGVWISPSAYSPSSPIAHSHYISLLFHIPPSHIRFYHFLSLLSSFTLYILSFIPSLLFCPHILTNAPCTSGCEQEALKAESLQCLDNIKS